MILVLDTNVFYAYALDGIHMSAISRISSHGYARLHIPYIVDKEVLTQKMASIEQPFRQIKQQINKLSKNENIAGDISDAVKMLQENLLSITPNSLKRQVNDKWQSWKSSSNAITIPISEQIAEDAMEAYFNGTEPYVEIKSRKDIPDSFIFEQLKNLTNQDQVIFICNDDRLRQSTQQLANITSYKNLLEFIGSEQAKRYIAQIDEQRLSKNLTPLAAYFRSNSKTIDAIVQKYGKVQIIFSTINQDDVHSDTSEFTISDCWQIDEVHLDLGQLTYYGDGEFELPAEYDAVVSLDYFIAKSDYNSSDEFNKPVTDWNDSVYKVQSEGKVCVKCILQISSNIDNFIKVIEGDTLPKISEFEISLDSIQSIEISQ